MIALEERVAGLAPHSSAQVRMASTTCGSPALQRSRTLLWKTSVPSLRLVRYAT